jgi:ABC-type transporter Mla MlaB component
MDRTPISFAIVGPLTRHDLPGLCRRVQELLERTGATTLTCDVSELAADAVAVDALARVLLASRRAGAQVILRRASDELLDLIGFVGLEDAMGEARPRGAAKGRRAGTGDRSRGRR